jgi:hypothetical protein
VVLHTADTHIHTHRMVLLVVCVDRCTAGLKSLPRILTLSMTGNCFWVTVRSRIWLFMKICWVSTQMRFWNIHAIMHGISALAVIRFIDIKLVMAAWVRVCECGSPRGSTRALTETICLPSQLGQMTPSRRRPGPTHSLTWTLPNWTHSFLWLITLNIRCGRYSNLNVAIRTMHQMRVDLGILMETKIDNDMYTRDCCGYTIFATHAKSQF